MIAQSALHLSDWRIANRQTPRAKGIAVGWARPKTPGPRLVGSMVRRLSYPADVTRRPVPRRTVADAARREQLAVRQSYASRFLSLTIKAARVHLGLFRSNSRAQSTECGRDTCPPDSRAFPSRANGSRTPSLFRNRPLTDRTLRSHHPDHPTSDQVRGLVACRSGWTSGLVRVDGFRLAWLLLEDLPSGRTEPDATGCDANVASTREPAVGNLQTTPGPSFPVPKLRHSSLFHTRQTGIGRSLRLTSMIRARTIRKFRSQQE